MKRLFFAALLGAATTLGFAPSAAAHDAPGAHAHDAPPSRALTESVVMGTGWNTFETVPGWPKVPVGEHFGATHGSGAVDKDGNIYISLDSRAQDGHGIAVYNKDGEFVKLIAKGVLNLHSLIYVQEGDKGFLYGAQVGGYMGAVKLDLNGNVVYRFVPPSAERGGGLRPTGVAVGPDGDIYLADGYGSNYIYQFDKEGVYIRKFGGRGQEDGKFRTCHGINVDYRHEEPRLLVCDREAGRLQYFTLEGEFIEVSTTGLRRPCAVVFYKDTAAVAELAGRAVILDKDNKVVSVLGDQPNPKFRANFRVEPKDWKEGIFNAPHGLTFTNEGDLIITEWNRLGRFAYLKRVPAEKAD